VARGVSKAFAGVKALSGVSFDVVGGEIHALLGENGAGKSTLIKVIAGVYHADAGDVRFRGERFAPRDPDESSRKGVGVVFQELPLVPDLTVAENIFFNRQPLTRLRTVAGRRMRSRAEELFEHLGLRGIDPGRQVRDLSMAARQLVAIAKVLAYDPAVLVLDEATSALGPAEVSWLLDRARHLATSGKGIIFISHRLAEVQAACDRVTVLRNGQSVGTWQLGDVGGEDLVSAMLGRRLAQLYPPRRSEPTEKVLLSVSNLSTSQRLRGVNLELHSGEILGMCGLEGQGQLDLFLALFGVVRSHGSISVEGVPRQFHSPRDAIRAGIGIALVPEDRKGEGMLPTLSVRENLSLPSLEHLHRFGILGRDVEQQFIGPAVKDLRIGRLDPEQFVGTLSGGNQQKVVVGKFLLTGAKVLLFYDLTRGVDVGTKAEIFRMMEDLAANGAGILYYSSDVTELVNVPHRIAVVFEGHIIREFRHGECEEESLVAAMVGSTGQAALVSEAGEVDS
jgi:ribose transport system ATP-binding protein